MVEDVCMLDEGPIPYSRTALYGDRDLEHGLRHFGVEPGATAYRLVDVAIRAIPEAMRMHEWRDRPDAFVDLVAAGVEFPPIVIVRSTRAWLLLDGVHRTFAFLVNQRPTIRAYELIRE